MASPTIIDDATAGLYMDTYDSVPPEEQTKRMGELQGYVSYQNQQKQAATVKQSFSDFDTLGGTWDAQGRTWDDEQKANVANRRFIAHAYGKTVDDTTYSFDSLRAQYAQEKFNNANLSGREFYNKVQKQYQDEDLREEGKRKLYDDTLVSAIDGKVSSPVEDFQKWKDVYGPAYPGMDEAGMLDTYTKARQGFTEQHGPLVTLAGEIIKSIPKTVTPSGPTVGMDGQQIKAPTDTLNPGQSGKFGTSFAVESSEALQPAAEKLAALSDEDRKKTLDLIVQYAHAKGIDPKPVAQNMAEAFGRSVGDITEGLSNLDAAGYLKQKESELLGIPSAGGLVQTDFENKPLQYKAAGYFNPDNLSESLASVRAVDPINPPEGAPPFLTQEQTAALQGEVERQRKISRTTRDLRMIAKGEIDPAVSANKGVQGFLENSAIGLAGIAPYIGATAVPYAGVPIVTAAIRASEYDRIGAEHPNMAEDNVEKLATYSGIAQGFSMMIGLRALEGLPVTGGLLKSLAAPSESTLGRIGKIVGQSALSAAELGVQGEIMAGTLGLTSGIASALEQDKPGVDWNKALSVFNDSQVGTFQTLAPLWLIGLGAISVRNVEGGMKLARDVNTLENIFGDRQVARQIAKAEPEKMDALIQKAFEEMPDSQKQDLIDRVDSHVAEVEAQQDSKNFPTIETRGTVQPDGTIKRVLAVKDSKGNVVFESPSLEAATQAWKDQRNHEYQQDFETATGNTTNETAKPAEATPQTESKGPGAGAASEHQNRRIVYGADVIGEMEKNGGTASRETWNEAMRKEYDGIEDTELDSIWSRSQDAYLEHQINAGTKPLTEIVRQKTAGETYKVSDSPISLKNESVDAERRSKNLPPAMQSAKRAFKGVWDEAMRHIDENPQYQSELIAKLKDDPSIVLNDRDAAILLQHQITVHNEYQKAVDGVNKAHESGDAEAIKTANETANKLLKEVQETYDIGQASGTAAGRALNIRKMMAREDYSLARITAKKMAASGRKLTGEEIQLLSKQHADLEAKQKALDEREAKVAEMEGMKTRADLMEAAMKRLKAKTEKSKTGEAVKAGAAKAREVAVKIGDKTRSILSKQAEAARQRISDRKFSFSSGVDPTVLADVAIIGAHHIAEGAATLAQWSERMIKDFGEKIKPHLDEIWAKAQEVALSRDAMTRTMDNLATRIAAGDEDVDLSRYANTLARDAVERGITDRDGIVQEVHAALSEAVPGITKRETEDAISGYGRFKELAKDTVSVQVRQVKGELQQIAKIEDMEAGKAPKKTGVEMREKGDEERRLTHIVNEMKKKGGYDVGDPAKTLRSALDAVKTRLRNQIKDLAYRIDTGKKPDPKNPSPKDAEVLELMAERDRLKKTVEAIEGKNGATDAQKIEIAKKAVDRSIEEISRRIKEGDFVNGKAKKLSSPELDAAKARRDALREEFKLLQNLDPEFRAQRTAKETADQIKSAQDSLAELDRKIQEGDFSNTAKAEKQVSPEVEALRAERAAVQKEYQRLKRESEETKSPEDKQAEKLQSQIDEIDRKLQEGDLYTVGKPSKVVSDRLEALQSERDALNKELQRQRNEAKPKKDKESAEIERVKKQIEELDAKLKAGDIEPKTKTPKVGSDALEALKAERAAMSAKIAELRAEAKPRKTKEEIALQAIKTRAMNRLAELQEKIAKSDFTKPVKKEPIKVDDETLKLRADIELAKQKIDEGIFLSQLENRSLGKKIVDNTKQTLNLARTIQTGFDLSAVFRQGGFLVLGHPLRAGKSIKAMLQAMMSPENEAKIWEGIKARDNFRNGTYKASKLFLADPNTHSLTKMEEAYMGRFQKYIPRWVGGGLLRGSNRAYTTFLNHLRADSFDALAESLSKSGTPTKEEAAAIANFVNVATGRGSLNFKFLGNYENSAELLNTVFFAPRYVTSRFQLLAGQPLVGGSMRTRKLIVSEYARYLAGLGTVLTLGLMAGGKIDTDPRSGNFGKLKFGNTYVDVLSGLGQATVFAARAIKGETISRGEVVPLRGEGSTPTAGLMVALRFMRSKLSPLAGGALSVGTGYDFSGKPTDLAQESVKMAQPMSGSDLIKIFQNNNAPAATVLGVLSLLGDSVSVQDNK